MHEWARDDHFTLPIANEEIWRAKKNVPILFSCKYVLRQRQTYNRKYNWCL